jgi:hypothetical protein
MPSFAGAPEREGKLDATDAAAHDHDRGAALRGPQPGASGIDVADERPIGRVDSGCP